MDQTVLELRRVNSNLEGLHGLLASVVEVERGVLAALGGLGRARAHREGAEEHVQGREGEVIQLRCRARARITWRVQRAGGALVELESRARKLKVRGEGEECLPPQ